MSPNAASSRSISIALLVLRLVFGFIFAAHGWQKYFDFTLAGTTSSFEQMGVPAAALAAPVVATLELAGGVALALGAATRVIAALLALDMLGALLMVHAGAGIFVGNGGFELVLLLAGGAAVLALAGPGRFAVDSWFTRRPERMAL